MSTKLTLSLDQVVVSKAKHHLQTKQQSLSQLVEDFFRALIVVNQPTTPRRDSPITQELIGSLKGKAKADVENARTEYLLEKYS